jgi:hypothetical protein
MGIPGAIKEALRQNYGNSQRGTATWLARQTKIRRRDFQETCRAYLEARVAGDTDMSLPIFRSLLIHEFDYPYSAGALRVYLEKNFGQLFHRQTRTKV